MYLLDRAIDVLLRMLRWLALPVALLLFLQWPLRDLVQLYSREANDLGQVLFAVFVAVSVVAATRAHVHLATDAVARRYSERTRRAWAVIAIVAALLPWALFVGWSGYPMIRLSVLGAERFPDTGNFGYFIVKLALGLLVVGIVLQGLLDLSRRTRKP